MSVQQVTRICDKRSVDENENLCGYCPTSLLLTALFLCPILVFSSPLCMSLHYFHPDSLKVQWPDALSLPMWRGANTFP